MKATKVIKVHTGYKTPEEINFINDLLSSDDVQLLTMNADVFKVLVSAQKVEQNYYKVLLLIVFSLTSSLLILNPIISRV